MAQPHTPTIYEDWLTRQAQLLEVSDPLRSAYRETQLQILDYLLKRYRHEPEAHRPARFPLSKGVIWNRRAQAVHRNLALRRAEVIRDQDDARSRIGPVLARMASRNAQSDLGPPAQGALGFGEALREAAQTVERDLAYSVRLHSTDLSEMDAYLTAFREMSPERQLVALRGHYHRLSVTLDDGLKARRGGLSRHVPTSVSLEFLKRCSHPDALGYLFLLWKDCQTAEGRESLRGDLEEHFAKVSERAGECFRFELANADARIRLRAARILGQIGTLDDIGLLSDLLTLPPQDDDAPGERDAILDALVALSRRTA